MFLGVAFVTLFERKGLSFSQRRLGPNKTLIKGVLQPVLDGVKLLTKEVFFSLKKRRWAFVLGPATGLIVMVILWNVLDSELENEISFFLGIFLMVLIGVRVYSSLISGWRGASRYASVGGVRSCSQRVSYEISLVLLFLLFFHSFKRIRNFCFISFLNWGVFVVLFLSCVAETNRAPFDFREGERELISGFNVEFGASGFVLLFLAEYGMVLFFCFLIRSLIFSQRGFVFVVLFFVIIFLRRVYPRFRYDFLIKINWFKFLPFILFFFLIIIILHYLFKQSLHKI